MKTVVLTLGVLLAGSASASAQAVRAACQANEATRALCAAEAQLTDALRRNDVDRLTALYDDDFSLINFRGRLIDKAGVLSALRSGALRFDRYRVYDSPSWSPDTTF